MSINLLAFGDSMTNTYTSSGYYTASLQSLIETRQLTTCNLTRIGAGGISWDYAYGGNPSLNTYISNNISLVNAGAKIVLFAGTNGLKLKGNTPAQEYAAFEIGLGLILAGGATASNIVVVTMLPRETYSDANRTIFNDLLVAGAATHGYKIAKLHLNYDIGVDQQQNETYWFSDQIHPTTTACDQIARIIYDQFYSDFYDNFTYADVPNFWDAWDAQQSAKITQSGSRVSQWQSFNGSRPLVQATSGNQPLYNATGINSLPAIEFDGAARRAWLQNASITFACKPMSWWFVGKSDDISSDNLFWYLGTDNTTWESGVRFLSEATNSIWRLSDALNGGSAVWTGGADTSIHVMSGRLFNGAAPKVPIFEDGVKGGSGAPNLTTQVNATALRIGSPVLDFWRLKGKIGEIGFCQGETSSYWLQLITKKLAAKWGMSAPNVP